MKMTERLAAAMERIYRDVALGRPAPAEEPAELRQYRRRLEREVEAIRRRGGDVQIPAETPDPRR